jgi:leader peptidase (prepilin peptidase)/N-methyltransferase
VAHRTGYWRTLWQFFWQRRVCPECKTRPRFRPALLIIAAVVLPIYLWSWATGSIVRFGIASVVASVFLLVAIIDLEHHLILLKVTLPSAAVMGMAAGLMTGWPTTLLGGLIGFGLMLVVYVVGVLVFKGHGIGAGDVILSGLVGLAVGADHVVPALVTGMMAGGIVALAYLTWGAIRRQSMRSQHLAYGPFIMIGAALAYFFL